MNMIALPTARVGRNACGSAEWVNGSGCDDGGTPLGIRPTARETLTCVMEGQVSILFVYGNGVGAALPRPLS